MSEEMLTEEDAQVVATERALIGGVLLDRGRTIPEIMPAEFFSDRHMQIWEVIRALAEGVDLPSLAHELARRNQLEAVGGPAYLAQCIEDGWLVIPERLLPYAAMVRDASRRRMLRALGRALAKRGFDEAEIARQLAEVPGPLTALAPWSPWAVFEAHQRSLVGAPPLPTGLASLDALLGGFLPGELVVLGARTSHGKTAMAIHLALTIAGRGVPVLLLSLEETAALMAVRAVSSRSGVAYRRLALGHALGEEEQREVDQALAWLEGVPWGVLSVETLRALDEDTVCGAVAASTAPVVIVDHLQKIRTGDESRVYGIERVLNRLHATALRDRRVVIVCAQLNRESENEKRAPRLSDLRDSGAVEILARKVLLLYWPFKHDATRDRHEYHIYIAKQSTGGTGTVGVRFRAETGSFWDDPTPTGAHA